MTSAKTTPPDLPLCPYCNRPQVRIALHLVACIKEPGREAKIAGALRDLDRPGMGLSRGRYNQIASEFGLPQGQALMEQVWNVLGYRPKWNEVLQYFGLSYNRRIDDDEAIEIVAGQVADDRISSMPSCRRSAWRRVG